VPNIVGFAQTMPEKIPSSKSISDSKSFISTAPDVVVFYFQPIIPDQSTVKLLGTKVEVILKKAESFSWPSLELKQEK